MLFSATLKTWLEQLGQLTDDDYEGPTLPGGAVTLNRGAAQLFEKFESLLRLSMDFGIFCF